MITREDFQGISPTVTSYHLDFEWTSKAYICVWLRTKLKREFCLAKMSYPLKRKWERFQENFIVKYSLKNSWANTCKSIKSSSMDLHCNILLLKIEFFFHSSYSMRLVKRLWVSCCKASEHKGWVVPVWFRLCKRNLQR